MPSSPDRVIEALQGITDAGQSPHRHLQGGQAKDAAALTHRPSAVGRLGAVEPGRPWLRFQLCYLPAVPSGKPLTLSELWLPFL